MLQNREKIKSEAGGGLSERRECASQKDAGRERERERERKRETESH